MYPPLATWMCLGAGAQADTIPNRRQGQRYKVPALTELSTCAIEVSTPHPTRPNIQAPFMVLTKGARNFYQEQS